MRILSLLFAVALMLGAPSTLADGRVVNPNPDPVSTWKIVEFRFFPAEEPKRASVFLAYVHESGKHNRNEQIDVAGAEYDAFLGALLVSIGEPEGGCVTGGVADRTCVFNLRLSHWLVTNGKIQGVTAESLPE